MAKKFEIKLTPQNEEWVKLIPNPIQNNDIVFNKLIEMAINDGLLLEVISQTLTVSDLAKFKTGYSKMQAKRLEYMSELDITPTYSERRKFTQDQALEVEQQEQVSEKSDNNLKTSRKMHHGFDEDTF